MKKLRKKDRDLLIAVVGLTLAACAWVFAFSPTPAKSQNLGDWITVIAYCTTEEAARKLSAGVKKDNDKGYVRVMNDPTVQCYDARMHDVQPPTVHLTSRAWTVKRADGQTYQFWRAVDQEGKTGFMWSMKGIET